MSEIANPHDKFFKEALSRRDVARDFILNYLPADIVAFLDIDSLVINKDSFVDKDLKEYSILRYVASGSDQINAENIKSVVRKIAGGKGDEIMPTLAEQWIEQGIQQGIQQGMQQGIQQGLKEAIEDVIELKFGSRGLKFLPRIEQVNEQSILKAIKVIIKSSESLEEAEGLIGELING